jgi:hypothetical protein
MLERLLPHRLNNIYFRLSLLLLTGLIQGCNTANDNSQIVDNNVPQTITLGPNCHLSPGAYEYYLDFLNASEGTRHDIDLHGGVSLRNRSSLINAINVPLFEQIYSSAANITEEDIVSMHGNFSDIRFIDPNSEDSGHLFVIHDTPPAVGPMQCIPNLRGVTIYPKPEHSQTITEVSTHNITNSSHPNDIELNLVQATATEIIQRLIRDTTNSPYILANESIANGYGYLVAVLQVNPNIDYALYVQIISQANPTVHGQSFKYTIFSEKLFEEVRSITNNSGKLFELDIEKSQSHAPKTNNKSRTQYSDQITKHNFRNNMMQSQLVTTQNRRKF